MLGEWMHGCMSTWCVGGCMAAWLRDAWVDVWVRGKGTYHLLLVGVQMGAATVEIVVEGPQEARNGTTM